jgi:hypothetical protein
MKEVLATVTTPHDCYDMRNKLVRKGLSFSPEQLGTWLRQMVESGLAIAQYVPDGQFEKKLVFEKSHTDSGEKKMGDMIEMYQELRQADSLRRAEKRESAPDQLRAHGISFEERNLGAHIIINNDGRLVDYWPGTGKWISRAADKKERGQSFASLAKYLGIPHSKGQLQ